MILQSLYKLIIGNRHPRILSRNNLFAKTIDLIAVGLYKQIFEYTQYISVKDMETIQKKRLLTLLKSAEKLPLYRNCLLEKRSAVKNFFSLPPTTKEQLRNAFEKDICINHNLSRFGITRFTSGSTGIPFKFLMDTNMFTRRRGLYRRMLAWVKKSREDTVISLMPKIHPGLEKECLFFQCADPEDLEKKIDQIYNIFENRTLIVQSRTSHLLRLAKLLEKDDKKFRFKALISYTEQLLPEMREYMEKIFKAPVFNYYACNELTAIAQECEQRNGFHINSEWVYLEILDKNNKPVKTGEKGFIVITAFDNEVMPFIRYKTGDIGYWLRDPCLCGRTLPRINVEGRENSSFLLPSGHFGYFNTLMWPLAQKIDKILQYQVVRKSINNFLIKLRPTPSFTENDKKILINRFKEYLGPKAQVSLEIVLKIEPMPSGKELVFINLAPEK